VGATMRRWPSVLISSGVSTSIFSRSRIGRSITSARLFPCLVSFFTMATSVTPMLPQRCNGTGPVKRLGQQFEDLQSGLRAQPACQQTRTCQRRKRRVWRVERGRRTEPWRLSAWPARRRFQPENRAETQVPANVWHNGRPQTAIASSKTGRREVTKFGCGSPLSTVLELSPGLTLWSLRISCREIARIAHRQ